MNAPNMSTIRSMYATHCVEYYGGEGHERAARRSEALAEFDALLDEVRAKAWDEGNDAGEICAMDAESPDHICQRNPYRRADR